jgi:dTDP-D-glucose 4,6-dehydratase
MSSKARTNGSNSSKKRRRAHPRKLAIGHGGESGRFTEKSYPTRRNPAKPKKSANDLMLDAWEYTYKTRERRLTKP